MNKNETLNSPSNSDKTSSTTQSSQSSSSQAPDSQVSDSQVSGSQVSTPQVAGSQMPDTQVLESQVLKFKYYVENLHEIEYGDFKRKLSLYILRLEQALPKSESRAHKIIATMREKILYNPKADIDEAREEILELASLIA